MSKIPQTTRSECVMLRLTEPLREELQFEADQVGLPLAAFLRWHLLRWTANRLAERGKEMAV
jgi:hypothetical protein